MFIEDPNGNCTLVIYPGDVNRDGIINILDLMLLVSMILNYEYDEVADMNGSGTLNIQDVLMMINIILGD